MARDETRWCCQCSCADLLLVATVLRTLWRCRYSSPPDKHIERSRPLDSDTAAKILLFALNELFVLTSSTSTARVPTSTSVVGGRGGGSSQAGSLLVDRLDIATGTFFLDHVLKLPPSTKSVISNALRLACGVIGQGPTSGY